MNDNICDSKGRLLDPFLGDIKGMTLFEYIYRTKTVAAASFVICFFTLLVLTMYGFKVSSVNIILVISSQLITILIFKRTSIVSDIGEINFIKYGLLNINNCLCMGAVLLGVLTMIRLETYKSYIIIIAAFIILYFAWMIIGMVFETKRLNHVKDQQFVTKPIVDEMKGLTRNQRKRQRRHSKVKLIETNFDLIGIGGIISFGYIFSVISFIKQAELHCTVDVLSYLMDNKIKFIFTLTFIFVIICFDETALSYGVWVRRKVELNHQI